MKGFTSLPSVLSGFLVAFSANVFADINHHSSLEEAKVFTDVQEKAIQKITHDYLVTHPQVLMEVASALQKQQQTQLQKMADDVIPKVAPLLFSSTRSPAVGNLKDADVVVVEFFDYACPHCKDLSPKVMDILKNDAHLKVIFKELPIFGGASLFAAKVALVAQQQGKFLPFHEALMKISVPLTKDIVLDIAQKTGVNISRIENALNNPDIAQEIKENTALAQQLKLNGTPAFVFAQINKNKFSQNPILIPGAVSENILIEAIGQARAKS